LPTSTQKLFKFINTDFCGVDSESIELDGAHRLFVWRTLTALLKSTRWNTHSTRRCRSDQKQ
jgi:hypothetical protein